MVAGEKIPKVAEYINYNITLAGKSNMDIGTALGYKAKSVNFISMLRTGRAKMPISKIATFAREVNVDPVYMMRLVLQEYSPDVYSSLDQYVALALTLSESNALRAIREGADGVAIELDKSELAWIKEIANRASLRTKQEQKKAEDIDKQRWNSPLNKD